jgi:hypothetical protein
MGYEYGGYSGSGFRLPQANVDRFRQAIVEMTGDGFWEGAQPPDPNDLAAILDALDWDYEENPEGDIISLDLAFGKHSDQSEVEEALIGLVVPGSELHCQGEDGEEWLLRYTANDYVNIQGRLVFPLLGEQPALLDLADVSYLHAVLPPGPETDALLAKLPPLPTLAQ